MLKQKQFTTKISKWGNGYGVRVPFSLLQELGLSDGKMVSILKEKNSIILKFKTPSLQNIKLSEFLKNLKLEDLREEDTKEFFGDRKGREIW